MSHDSQSDSIKPNNMHPNNEESVLIDDPAKLHPDNPPDSYEGRKHEPEIDGPQQKSQETDEIYADPRKEENLPPGGKNIGDLNAYDGICDDYSSYTDTNKALKLSVFCARFTAIVNHFIASIYSQ